MAQGFDSVGQSLSDAAGVAVVVLRRAGQKGFGTLEIVTLLPIKHPQFIRCFAQLGQVGVRSVREHFGQVGKFGLESCDLS